jgi:rubredoxin
MAPLPNFKQYPDYFYCKTLSAWMRKSLCVEYQVLAKKPYQRVDFLRGTYFKSADRDLSCINCQQGKEIAREFKSLPDKPKPTLKLVQPRKPKIRRKHLRPRRDAMDWQDLMQGYNRKYGKNWKSVKLWLGYLHQEYGSQRAAAKVLGISHTLLCRKMQELGLGRKKAKGSAADRFLEIPAKRMAGMTKLEIAAETGLSDGTVGRLLNEYHRRYVMAGTWRGRS